MKCILFVFYFSNEIKEKNQNFTILFLKAKITKLPLLPFSLPVPPAVMTPTSQHPPFLPAVAAIFLLKTPSNLQKLQSLAHTDIYTLLPRRKIHISIGLSFHGRPGLSCRRIAAAHLPTPSESCLFRAGEVFSGESWDLFGGEADG